VPDYSGELAAVVRWLEANWPAEAGTLGLYEYTPERQAVPEHVHCTCSYYWAPGFAMLHVPVATCGVAAHRLRARARTEREAHQ
jgi:hypothetical protein